jgi:hypothetical protein
VTVEDGGELDCGSDEPACGLDCCLPDAPCVAGSDGGTTCGCPDGQDACGEWCCAGDEQCVDGVCSQTSSQTCTAQPQCDSNGNCGACNSQADCCGGTVCVSQSSCLVNSVASGCTCNTSDASGVCVDATGTGINACSNDTGCPQGNGLMYCCAGYICVNGVGMAPQCQLATTSVCGGS